MITAQSQVNWEDPEQHVSWAMQYMPTVAGIGAVTNPAILRSWSKHLFDAGFRHVDWLRSLADENGMISVDRLPEQRIKLLPAFRGPRVGLNNAARWAEMDAPDPPTFRLPDIRDLTQQENEVMLDQYRAAGMIQPYAPAPDMAEVET